VFEREVNLISKFYFIQGTTNRLTIDLTDVLEGSVAIGDLPLRRLTVRPETGRNALQRVAVDGFKVVVRDSPVGISDIFVCKMKIIVIND
jgi:hypothetical protein